MVLFREAKKTSQRTNADGRDVMTRTRAARDNLTAATRLLIDQHDVGGREGCCTPVEEMNEQNDLAGY